MDLGEETFRDLLLGLSEDELEDILEDLPASAVRLILDDLGAHGSQASLPRTPLAQAQEADAGYRARPHLSYLSDRLAQAAEDVAAGTSRKLLVSMPPRMGKSHLTSTFFPLWLLRKFPTWKLALISHSPHLAVSWGRAVRRIIEEHGQALGMSLAKDGGAAADWQMAQGGGVTARSMPGQSITGLGFKVMLIDDPVKDVASAHSKVQRDAAWDWWQAVASTRLEPPSLVVVVMTRWHEDDLAGRLLSREYGGKSNDWEVISLPALAEGGDVLGRPVGEPLISPLLDETPEQALARWQDVRETVGEYAWSALYQQRPAPSEGAIFMLDKLRYWTTDPSRVTADGSVVLLDEDVLAHGKWLDSWDCTFKGGDNSDYVVGQRWVRVGADRYLIDQRRGRWTFTQTLGQMEAWGNGGGKFGAYVHQRLIEDTANGTAALDVLRRKIAGLKPITPRGSKEVRARAVTPEIESGNVLLPHPSEHAWVNDLLSELRNFPHDKHDDQVDALTQALKELRDESAGGVTIPKGSVSTVRGPRNLNAAGASRLRAARSTGRRV